MNEGRCRRRWDTLPTRSSRRLDHLDTQRQRRQLPGVTCAVCRAARGDQPPKAMPGQGVPGQCTATGDAGAPTNHAPATRSAMRVPRVAGRSASTEARVMRCHRGTVSPEWVTSGCLERWLSTSSSAHIIALGFVLLVLAATSAWGGRQIWVPWGPAWRGGPQRPRVRRRLLAGCLRSRTASGSRLCRRRPPGLQLVPPRGEGRAVAALRIGASSPPPDPTPPACRPAWALPLAPASPQLQAQAAAAAAAA